MGSDPGHGHSGIWSAAQFQVCEAAEHHCPMRHQLQLPLLLHLCSQAWDQTGAFTRCTAATPALVTCPKLSHLGIPSPNCDDDESNIKQDELRLINEGEQRFGASMSTPCLSIAPHLGCFIRLVECLIACICSSACGRCGTSNHYNISHGTQTLAQQSHACLLHRKHEQTAEHA